MLGKYVLRGREGVFLLFSFKTIFFIVFFSICCREIGYF